MPGAVAEKAEMLDAVVEWVETAGGRWRRPAAEQRRYAVGGDGEATNESGSGHNALVEMPGTVAVWQRRPAAERE